MQFIDSLSLLFQGFHQTAAGIWQCVFPFGYVMKFGIILLEQGLTRSILFGFRPIHNNMKVKSAYSCCCRSISTETGGFHSDEGVCLLCYRVTNKVVQFSGFVSAECKPG